MYEPNTLENERWSWRAVIYFNVVRSLKHILSTLELWGDSLDDPDVDRPHSSHSNDDGGARSRTSQSSVASSNSSPASSVRTRKESLKYQIATLRQRLSPLVAADAQLAERLADGVVVSGSGKGNVFVRTGWQARSIENGLGLKRPRTTQSIDMKSANDKPTVKGDTLAEEVGKMLEASKQDIHDLWKHPTVRTLISKRKLRLDEWEELCVVSSLGHSP
jgi:hypothetical protein